MHFKYLFVFKEYEFGWHRGDPLHFTSRFEQGKDHRFRTRVTGLNKLDWKSWPPQTLLLYPLKAKKKVCVVGGGENQNSVLLRSRSLSLKFSELDLTWLWPSWPSPDLHLTFTWPSPDLDLGLSLTIFWLRNVVPNHKNDLMFPRDQKLFYTWV